MRTLKEIISKLEILLQNEKYSEALSVMNDFDPSLQNNEPHSPDRIDLLLMMVKIYLFNHLHEKAKECLSQLEGACKNIAADVEYINLKRQLLIVEGKIEEASSLLEEAAHNTLTKRQRHLITYYKGDIHFLKGE